MSGLKHIQDSLPDYAKDIKLNLSSLLNGSEHLNSQQFWGTLLASALACPNQPLREAVTQTAQEKLSNEAFLAAKSAAAIMAMNNIYYRFTHLVSNADYQTMPANLRMSVMATPGVDKVDFELFSLAVSAINGCGKCMDAHEKVLLAKGMSKEGVQTGVRIAAILHAVSAVLECEKNAA